MSRPPICDGCLAVRSISVESIGLQIFWTFYVVCGALCEALKVSVDGFPWPKLFWGRLVSTFWVSEMMKCVNLASKKVSLSSFFKGFHIRYFSSQNPCKKSEFIMLFFEKYSDFWVPQVLLNRNVITEEASFNVIPNYERLVQVINCLTEVTKVQIM